MSASDDGTLEYGRVVVELRCEYPGAEVLLIDGQLKLVGRALQTLRVAVPPGVYTSRVLIGEALRDERVIVRPDQQFSRELQPPRVSSAMPLEGSAKSHEYHQEMARSAAGADIPVHPDGDASVFVLLREWTVEGAGQRSRGPLAPELVLRSQDSSDLHTFSVDSAEPGMLDRAIAQGVRLRRGFYRLVSQWGSGRVIEMPVYALAGWQTQIYLLSELTPNGLAPDFGRASVLWAQSGSGFDPNREDLRILESVLFAASAGRQQVTDRGLTEALYQKAVNPMLGLVSAHALLQRRAIEPSLLAHVTATLETMLGPIPDIVALQLAVDRSRSVTPVEYPPMLRWSWDLLLKHSVERPDVIQRHSLAEQISSVVIGCGVWMSWAGDPNGERLGLSTPAASREAAASVRETWQEINRPNTLWTPRVRKKSSRERVTGLEALPESAPESSLEGIVRTLGVPRAVIEEAIGSAAIAAAAAPQPSKGVTLMNVEKRKQFNERFLQRLLARRPQDRQNLEKQLRDESRRLEPEAALGDVALESLGPSDVILDSRDLALETIVNRERPVLFVRDGQFDTTEVTALGAEALDLVNRMKDQGSRLYSALPLIGRIDVVNFPNLDFVGTGWFVDTDIVVTNRHVAKLIAQWDGRKFAFSRGIAGQFIESSFCNAHEFDDLAPDASRVFKVTEVLYIEPENGPHDIGFLKVSRRTDGGALPFIPVATNDAVDEMPVCVIGYPARAPKRIIPDQQLMKQLYRDRYDVKRAAPGFTSGIDRGSTTHDCTTLGGNSGSVVLELATGVAVGLHYAGIYEEDNFAVRASVLTDYIKRKRWNTPPVIETRSPSEPAGAGIPIPSAPAPVATSPASAPASTVMSNGTASVTITIPVTVTVTIGAPQDAAGVSAATVAVAPQTPLAPSPAAPAVDRVDVSLVEQVLLDFWSNRPQGVLAVRVGYLDEGDQIGDTPCIAVSVQPSKWADIDLGGPHFYKGVPIRYLPADLDEQVQALPAVESVDSISYDDDARTGERFSFAPVNESMSVTLHVGPEYSWEILEEFLKGGTGGLVSGIYEFHAPHIKDAIESRLNQGNSVQLVMDNATFSDAEPGPNMFDRVAVFEDWADRFSFQRIVAPEGTAGLISDSYHIKVTVRDDDTFWLSSGNWKGTSSQPIITQEQRDNAGGEDLPGNREWHVVIRNRKLASRFRNHIAQDFLRSEALGGGPVSKSLMDETLVDVPIAETIELERRPPGSVLKPKTINRKVRVRPLLTPDREGAVYSEAVLDLIASARTSLLFQIPYIGMPSNPKQDRGFIDDLIGALTRKLKTLDDARVLLRSGGKKFSAPSHAAWFFKSKGVDIDNRVRVIDDHHTKGMIVDGRRVLIGSHNWSKPGVTLNRDASLLFDDEEIALYYAEAFEIDWQRANRVKPRKFVKPEAVVLEAVGDAPPPGFQRVRLADLVKEDD